MPEMDSVQSGGFLLFDVLADGGDGRPAAGGRQVTRGTRALALRRFFENPTLRLSARCSRRSRASCFLKPFNGARDTRRR